MSLKIYPGIEIYHVSDQTHAEYKGETYTNDASAEIELKGGALIISTYKPMTYLMEKLEISEIGEWRRWVDSIYIDFNCINIFSPTLYDMTRDDGMQLVSGIYHIPSGAGKICVKITDLINESILVNIERKTKK